MIVTGSSGFIGRSLVAQFKSRGDYVIGIDRKPARDVPLNEFHQLDLTDPTALLGLPLEVDCICHLAAAKDDWGISRDEYFRDNVEATRVLIDAARKAGVRDWVFYSTVAVLGQSEQARDEEAPFSSDTDYGDSKVEAEMLFLQLVVEEPDTRVLVIRPSAVYGVEQPPTSNVYRLIDGMRRGRFVMIGDGSNIKTLSHIDNLLAAHLFLMDQDLPKGMHVFHYVDEPKMTTGELVRRISSLIGRRPPMAIPLWLVKPFGTALDVTAKIIGVDLPITGDRMKKFAAGTNYSSSKIRGLGFEQPVTNERAIEATVRWQLSHDSLG